MNGLTRWKTSGYRFLSAMAKYFPTVQATFDAYLQWRLAQQQLTRQVQPDPVHVFRHCGPVTPAQPTLDLALHVRGIQSPQAAVRDAMTAGAVVPARTVRGIRLLAARDLAPYLIAAARRQLDKRWRPLWKAVSADEAARTAWGEQLRAAIGADGASAEALAAKLPPELLEPLAPRARKVTGYATRFDMLLAELEGRGIIVERNAIWHDYRAVMGDAPHPDDVSDADARRRVIHAFYEWGNVASAEDLAWWGEWRPRDVEEVLFSGELPLSHLVLAGSQTRGLMMLSRFSDSLKGVKTQREGPVHFLPARDPFFGHNPFLITRTLTEAQQAVVLRQSSFSLRPLVIERGRPIAVWSWSESQRVELTPVGRVSPTLRRAMTAGAETLAQWLQANGTPITAGYGK
jgi:hypothetical protein